MRRGEGRAEIVHAARQEFARLGYAGASTAGIARLAGVAQPLVHHHFGSKLGLWRAVVDDAFSGLLGAIDAAAHAHPPDGVGGHPARFSAIIQAMMRAYARCPELPRLEAGASGEAADVLWDVWLRQLHERMETELAGARKVGLLLEDASPVHLALILRGALASPLLDETAARRAFDVSDPAQVDAYAASVVRTLLLGVVARGSRDETSRTGAGAADAR